MKAGDLVKSYGTSWEDVGLVIEAETDGRIGHYRVLWPDGDCWWTHKKILRVVSGSR